MTATEKLPWLVFDYRAVSGKSVLLGIVELECRMTRDGVEEALLNRAAHLAAEQGVAWNPFNVHLTFIPHQ